LAGQCNARETSGWRESSCSASEVRKEGECTMEITNRNVVTLLITLQGAIKLTLESFGISIITDAQINAIANLVAIILTIAGIVMTHLKNKKKYM
jgi:hypothetical protein